MRHHERGGRESVHIDNRGKPGKEAWKQQSASGRQEGRERTQSVGVHLHPDVFIHLYVYIRRRVFVHSCAMIGEEAGSQ